MATGGAVVRIRSKTGAFLDVLPEYDSLDVSIEHNDAGNVVLDVPLSSKGAATLLAQDVALLEVVEGSTSLLWGVYDEDDDDPADDAGSTRSLTIAAPGSLSLLSWAAVYPEAGFNTPAYASFVNVTPGSTLLTLLQRAQARGTLDGTNGPLITPSFTATTDSAGNPWPLSLWLRWEAGKSLLDVTQDLIERGFIDTRMRGLTWDLYAKDTALAVDRPGVTFHRSREVTSSPRRRARADLRTALLVTGDGGLSTEVNDATAIARYGRREGFAGQSGISTGAVLATVGGYLLTQQKRYKEGFTTTYDRAAVGAPVPLVDYGPGDFTRADWYRDANTGANLPIRVRGLALSYGSDGSRTVEVTFNDLFLEADEIINRRIQALTQGSTGVAVVPPTPISADTVGPLAPSICHVDSTAPVATERGPSLVTATISWPAVTQNTDGSVFDDLGAYRVSWSINGSAYTGDVLTQGTAVNAVRIPAGATLTARVAAADHNGHVSGYTYSAPTLLNGDTTGPMAPTAPTVVPVIGGLRVTWDGLGVGGVAMDLDFSYTQAYFNTVNNFATATPGGAPLTGAGSTTITGLSYAAAYYVWLVGFDRYNNRGTASATQAGAPSAPTQVLSPDLGGGAVGPAAFQYRSFDNLVPDGSFEQAKTRDRLTADPSWGPAWSWVNAGSGAESGGWLLRGAGGTSPGSTRTLNLITGVEVLPGQKVWLAFKAKGTGGANGAVRLIITPRDSTGAAISGGPFIDVTTADGTWQTPLAAVPDTVGNVFTYLFPSNAATYDVAVQLLSSVTAGTWDVDSVQVRTVLQTAIIDQAAIDTAQIALLSVGSAQVGEISATKMSAGTLAAMAISLGAGLLTSAALDIAGVPVRTGARMELDATGLRVYDASSTSPANGKVVSINADGTATFAGDITGASGTFGGTVSAANITTVNFDNLLQDGGFEQTQNFLTYTAAFTANAGWTSLVDTSSGAVTATLPTATAGTVCVVEKTNSGGSAVTVQGTGGQQINGATTYSIPTQWQRVVFTASAAGGSWVATSQVLTAGQPVIGYWWWGATAGTSALRYWSCSTFGTRRTGLHGANRAGGDNVQDSVRYGSYIPCSAGDIYTVAAWVFSTAATTAGATAKVRIFWYDSTQTFLSTSSGSAVNVGGGVGWTRSVLTDTPPANAAFLRIDLWVSALTAGLVAFDDVICRRVVSDEQVGSITGSTITGGVFQTTSATNVPRIVMTGTTFYAYLLLYPGNAPEHAGYLRAYPSTSDSTVAGVEISSGVPGGGSFQTKVQIEHNFFEIGMYGSTGFAAPQPYISMPRSSDEIAINASNFQVVSPDDAFARGGSSNGPQILLGNNGQMVTQTGDFIAGRAGLVFGSGNLFLASPNSANDILCRYSGGVTATYVGIRASSFDPPSSIAYKTGVEELPGDGSALASIRALRPVSYRYRQYEGDREVAPGPRRHGLIAEEVREVLPHIWAPPADDETEGGAYDLVQLVTTVIRAVQDLDRRVDTVARPGRG